MQCKILIIGGGIDGAIANFYLSQKYDVVLVDKSRFGYSCTACATALLEYQLDEYASDLTKFMSESNIRLAYMMGIDSINEIDNFIKNMVIYVSLLKDQLCFSHQKKVKLLTLKTNIILELKMVSSANS